MRQVPLYTIIGAGRLAQHLAYYLNQLCLPFQQWSRSIDPAEKELKRVLQNAQHVLLAINDSAIEPFINTHSNDLHNKVIVHFSGSLITASAHGAHPLMAFSSNLYSEDIYPRIPFILEYDSPAFDILLPKLPNPHFRIPKHDKTFYHALCVLGGNFTCLLWQKLFQEFAQRWQIPREALHLYLQQNVANLINQPEQALTGPLVRNDQLTLIKNLAALQGDPFQQVYESFVNAYSLMQGKNDEH